MKTRHRWSVAAVAAAAASSLLLAGCSTSGAEQSTEKPDTLRVLYTTSEANAAALQAEVPAFEEKFGVKLAIDTPAVRRAAAKGVL